MIRLGRLHGYWNLFNKRQSLQTLGNDFEFPKNSEKLDFRDACHTRKFNEKVVDLLYQNSFLILQTTWLKNGR